MAIQQITVPDVGGANDVEVIEILVNVGDVISVDDALMTLESDKASMDVPAPMAGTVTEINVAVGDQVNEGSLILSLEVAGEATTNDQVASESDNEAPAVAEPSLQQVLVPDVGGTDAVDVIEILVKVGDTVAIDDAIVTLESDKASMDVPSPFAGIITEINVKVDDKVNEGSLLLSMQAEGQVAQPATASKAPSAPAPQAAAPAAKPANANMAAYDEQIAKANQSVSVYAGPAVRRVAQEFGIDLTKLKGTGRKNRIVKEDVQLFVKQRMRDGGGSGAGLDLLPWPNVDFAKFGEVETLSLNKIKRATAKNLHRNWVMIPHVTQFDDADITAMEKFRQENKAQAIKDGYKLTPIVFIMKAVVLALQEFPMFNSSLDVSGEHLVMKKYFNVGVAVDTPNGLVVPVIKDADKKAIHEIALELGEISVKARDKKLTPKDMQGGNFAISSLGGIGGTAFTPIVNAPDVAILGVSKSSLKPIWNGKEFEPRLMLPLSLSYDHRVIDGAEAARFITFLSACLGDLNKLLL